MVGLSPRADTAPVGATTVRGRVEDAALLQRVLSDYGIDTVFHLAAQSLAGAAGDDPAAAFEVNVRGTWNLLEACRTTPSVGRVVVASSERAAAVDDRDPRQRKLQPYFVSKRCAELIAGSYHETYGTPVCVARISNLFGGGDVNASRIVPGTIQAVLRDEPPVIRSDGSPLRDYMHVEDMVDGLLLLARQMDDPEICGRVFTFRSGALLSVLELTRKILTLLERQDLEPRVLDEIEPEPPMDEPSGQPVPGWRLKTTLDRRLRETIEWYQRQAQAKSG